MEDTVHEKVERKASLETSDARKKSSADPWIQVGLFAVAGVSLICAYASAVRPNSVNELTLKFVGLALLAIGFGRISKFKGLGIELEQRLDDIEGSVVALEKDVGPGSKLAPPTAPTTSVPPTPVRGLATARAKVAEAEDTTSAPTVDPDDPNKRQFGGKAIASGRRLSATIKPATGSTSARCRVKIRVESTDPNDPLKGEVILHLHPTFGQWASYPVRARGGVAEDEIVSYGAFTVGAETDAGATRLELDLMDIPGGTKAFYDA